MHSLAVLPLANVSGDPSQDYFADGMTDELITRFAQNTPLRVVSRTTVMQYKNAKRPIHDIARELGVDAVLEGSASKTNDRVHLTVQLIDAATDSHLWAESYDSTGESALQLPSQISSAVAQRLKTASGPASPVRSVNPEAYDAYLRGRYYWFNFNDRQSQQYYEKAIALQPDYAAAWAGLSTAFAIRAVDDQCLASDVIRQVESAARKAVELDPNLAEAHHAMAAYYLFYKWDPAAADLESRRSIELDPTIAEQHHLRGYIMLALNRLDDVVAEEKRANELAPFERPWGLGYTYLQVGRFDDGLNELRMRVDASPRNAEGRLDLAEAYYLKQMFAESEAEYEQAFRLWNAEDAAKGIHEAYLRGGEREATLWRIKDLQKSSKTGYTSAYQFAQQYARLQDRDLTLAWLEKSLYNRDPWLILIQGEPAFNFLHDDPRYLAIIHSIGLQRRTLASSPAR